MKSLWILVHSRRRIQRGLWEVVGSPTITSQDPPRRFFLKQTAAALGEPSWFSLVGPGILAADSTLLNQYPTQLLEETQNSQNAQTSDNVPRAPGPTGEERATTDCLLLRLHRFPFNPCWWIHWPWTPWY